MNETSKELTTFSEEDIKSSQEMSGQASYKSNPFIPIYTVNNRSDKKVMEIDGQETEVKIPPKKGFQVLDRNESANEFANSFSAGDLNAVILRERFMIEKKFKNKEDEQYKSDEFESWILPIEVYDKKDRKRKIFKGNYSQIKEKFTKMSDEGKRVKEFDLYVILYVNIEASGQVARVKLKMNSDCNWFTYKNEFQENEPWAGFMTKFKLVEKTTGEITYWHSVLERGEQVDLTEQLKLQKELNNLFNMMKKTKEAYSSDSIEYDRQDSQLLPEGDNPFLREGQELNEINVEDIPF
jgi:hypothetical protein